MNPTALLKEQHPLSRIDFIQFMGHFCHFHMWYPISLLSVRSTDRSVKMKEEPCNREKYVFIIKNMDILSKSPDELLWNWISQMSSGAGLSIQSWNCPISSKSLLEWVLCLWFYFTVSPVASKFLRTSNCKPYSLEESLIVIINGICFISWSHTLAGPSVTSVGLCKPVSFNYNSWWWWWLETRLSCSSIEKYLKIPRKIKNMRY